MDVDPLLSSDAIKGVKRQLASALRAGSVILLAGAGCSVSMGYPDWRQLVDLLRENFAPRLVRGDELDSEFAERIVGEIRSTGNMDAYHNFLEAQFRPPSERDPYEDFHLVLVQMGFAGLVTTNYDDILETSVMAANNSGRGVYRCQTIDLCSRQHPVFEFLRSLNSNSRPSSVLHLHGHYREPEKLILTNADYRRSYGETQSREGGDLVLDTLHRRVIWTLLAMHPVFFIGFGFADPFFNDVLKIVKTDFKLGIDIAHFALMSYSSEEDQAVISQHLRDHNIKPVFYEVKKDESGKPDHSNFRHTILELARSVGVPALSGSGIGEINRRMLEL
jgi:SIR2-like domain